MRTKKTIVEFMCDRCRTTQERNINEHSGVLFSMNIKTTEDMKYGNSIESSIDLCQKCSESFNDFMKNLDSKLQYFYDRNVGLYATDRPDLVDDTKHSIMFEIKD